MIALEAVGLGLVTLGALAVVFGALERAFPACRQAHLRAEFVTDVAFFAGQYLLWHGCVTQWLSASLRLFARMDLGHVLGLSRLSLPAQGLCCILLGDVLVYFGHRASHRYEWLWRFHRVHHTSERLDWLAAYREHPLDGLFTQTLQNLPAIALGLPFEAIAGVVAFRSMWGVFIHSNVRLPLGPLKLLLGAPVLHRFHHDREHGGHVNFANLLPVLDVLFGTYRDPGAEPAQLGVAEPTPRRYLPQLLFPFVPLAWMRRMIASGQLRFDHCGGRRGLVLRGGRRSASLFPTLPRRRG